MNTGSCINMSNFVNTRDSFLIILIVFDGAYLICFLDELGDIPHYFLRLTILSIYVDNKVTNVRRRSRRYSVYILCTYGHSVYFVKIRSAHSDLLLVADLKVS